MRPCISPSARNRRPIETPETLRSPRSGRNAHKQGRPWPVFHFRISGAYLVLVCYPISHTNQVRQRRSFTSLEKAGKIKDRHRPFRQKGSRDRIASQRGRLIASLKTAVIL